MVDTKDPKEIEAQSFKLIDSFLRGYKMPPSQRIITQRVIHASAEPNYAKDLLFHPKAINAALKAIKLGRDIIVDSNMVKAGINKKLLSQFGSKIICRINDKNVIRESLKLNLTRAMLSMRISSKLINDSIVAIGNAPTALFEVCDLVKNGKTKPALIIGLPVGFVGAVESKKELLSLKVPYITNRVTKGGSAVAVAIVNALLKIAKGGDEE